MKTTYKLNLGKIEVRNGDKILTVNDSSFEGGIEYNAEEVIENIKSLPGLIKSIKELVNEAVKEFSEAAIKVETARANRRAAETELEKAKADRERVRQARFHHRPNRVQEHS